MPLQKILFKPGVNRENTRYTSEGGWYECDKVRFRQGNPETIGGWVPFSLNTFMGVCRSLWSWITLSGEKLLGVGTNLKFYINNGGSFLDITPLRATTALAADPFALTASTTVTVTAASHGCVTGDFVTFSGAVDIGGAGTNVTAAILNKEFQVAVVNANSYTITLPVVPNAAALLGSPGGGASVVAAYQLNVGGAISAPSVGWGAGAWSSGSWGNTTTPSGQRLRIWNQQNYGQDLVYGPRGAGIYYWTVSGGGLTRGKPLNSLGGAVTFTVASPTLATFSTTFTEGTSVQFSVSSGGTLPTGISASTTYFLSNVEGLQANLLDSSGALVNVTGAGSGTFSVSLIVDVPIYQNVLMVSDVSRFIFAMGCNDYGSNVLDPMLIRWSDQDNPYEWTPNIVNQAGSIRLSHGSEIITAIQTRQEIVVFTDASLYSLQYLGPPLVWGSQLLGDNISIAGPNAIAVASGVIYWMGVDKFYSYDGRIQTLQCDLRRYVFGDFNQNQGGQVYAGTNEAFNEVWWFYCSITGPNGTNTPENPNNQIDRYVIYNYLENIWYYGKLDRTAWLDSGLLPVPIAVSYDPVTQTGRIINHETGLNDNVDGTSLPLTAYISSSEFDIGDGHNFGFVWRVIPDLTFTNSTSDPTTGLSPRVTMSLAGLANSGSGVIDTKSGVVAKTNQYLLTQEFTGQIFTRVRGRQMIFEIESSQLNTAWQLGAPRIDIRQDGRR